MRSETSCVGSDVSLANMRAVHLTVSVVPLIALFFCAPSSVSPPIPTQPAPPTPRHHCSSHRRGPCKRFTCKKRNSTCATASRSGRGLTMLSQTTTFLSFAENSAAQGGTGGGWHGRDWKENLVCLRWAFRCNSRLASREHEAQTGPRVLAEARQSSTRTFGIEVMVTSVVLLSEKACWCRGLRIPAARVRRRRRDGQE